MTPVAPAIPMRRAAFLSDVHLGSRHCHAEELAEFCPRCAADGFTWSATSSTCGGSRAAARPGAAHNRVVEALHALRRAGTGSSTSPATMIDRCAASAGWCCRRCASAGAWSMSPPTDAACWSCTATNSTTSPLRQPAGKIRRLAVPPHPKRQQIVERGCRRLFWPALLVAVRIPQAPERRGGALHRALRAGGLGDAKRRGLDGIVCGHIHRAALVQRDAWSTPTTATGSKACRRWSRRRTARCGCCRIAAKRWRKSRRGCGWLPPARIGDGRRDQPFATTTPGFPACNFAMRA